MLELKGHLKPPIVPSISLEFKVPGYDQMSIFASFPLHLSLLLTLKGVPSITVEEMQAFYQNNSITKKTVTLPAKGPQINDIFVACYKMNAHQVNPTCCLYYGVMDFDGRLLVVATLSADQVTLELCTTDAGILDPLLSNVEFYVQSFATLTA